MIHPGASKAVVQSLPRWYIPPESVQPERSTRVVGEDGRNTGSKPHWNFHRRCLVRLLHARVYAGAPARGDCVTG